MHALVRHFPLCIESHLHSSEVELCCARTQAFDTYMRDTTAKLGRKIEDLEDVHAIMPVLKEVRSPSRACTHAWGCI